MISSITGTVVEMDINRVVINTAAGLGFELFPSKGAQALCHENSTVTLQAYLQVVESGMTLFGFADKRERELFLTLTTVKGVGGKVAMTVMQALDIDTILHALMEGDSKLLTAAPGVGKKTADRLCFELSSKIVDKFTVKQPGMVSSVTSFYQPEDIVLDALVQLGANRETCARICRDIVQRIGNVPEPEELIQLCLQELYR